MYILLVIAIKFWKYMCMIYTMSNPIVDYYIEIFLNQIKMEEKDDIGQLVKSYTLPLTKAPLV